MTVAELDARMSRAEFQSWILYIEENGPVNPMLRIDNAVARAVLPFLKKGTPMSALMPWPDSRLTSSEEAPANSSEHDLLFTLSEFK